MSGYTPGRRGLAWLKLKKAFATLDVDRGCGRVRVTENAATSSATIPMPCEMSRTTASVTVGKAYTGLTDVEIAGLTRHFMENTLEDEGRRRTVVPDTVLEIAFDSIQPSDRHESGYALRFPRIARIRADKTVSEIDTLETCRRLAGSQAFSDVA